MRHTITTIIGDFTVHMSYKPTSEDLILNRLTSVINHAARKPLLIATEENPDMGESKINDIVIHMLDEAKLEQSLYMATTAGNGAGAGQRTTLSLKTRTIEISNS